MKKNEIEKYSADSLLPNAIEPEIKKAKNKLKKKETYLLKISW